MVKENGLVRLGGNAGQESEQALVKAALAELQAQKERGNSYFSQVPMEYRERVRSLAQDNFSYHKDKFNSFEEFLEAISRNWLAKKAVFGKLAEAAGFTKTQSFSTVPIGSENDYATAMLTKSASFLLVGPGAFDFEGAGAAYQYTKIDLRKSGPENTTSETGGRFEGTEWPQVGGSITLKGMFRTSEIISLYVKRVSGEEITPQSIREINRAMTDSFIDIDHQTIVREILKREKQ